MSKFLDKPGLDTFWAKIKSTFQPVADRVTSIRAASSATDTKYPTEKAVRTALDDYRTKLQDASKGGVNLVVNGNGVVGTNYNFGARTFIGNTDLPEGTAGCFHAVANTIWHDEPIAVDVGKTYEAEVWYRVKSANTSTVRFSVCCFDVDGKEIQAISSTYGVGTLTELTQDLKPGDTVVHLADLSGANWLSETNYHHGFIFWNYQNSLGYTYPPETYSRNVYPQGNGYLWDDSSAVNVSAGTITLKAAWNGPTIPAGTKVSRRNSGVVYKYIQSTASSSASTSWEKLSGKVFGMTSPGSTDGGSFRRGTAYIRIGFYNSNTTTNEYIEFTGMSLRELPAKLATARKLKTNLARTSDSTFDGSADQLNIPVTGMLPVGNGGTGKASVTAGNYVVGAGTSAMVEKTPKDVGSDVLSSLDNKSNASSYADFVDGDFVVGSDHVNASTISASTFVRRTALNLWNYIRSKLSGSDVNIGGNAANATTARDFDTSTGTIKSALAGKSDTGHVHNTDANEVTSNSTNLEVVTDTTEFVTTNTSGYSSSDKKLYRRPIKSKLWPWIASNLESEAGYINYTYNVTSDTNINSHVLAGIILPGSSLGSCRLMFAMVVNFNIGEGAGCGGLVKVHIEISGGGIYYVKRISLSNVTGDLSISDLKIVEGTSANKKVVGLVWNGVLLSNRPVQATVLSRHVVGGDFVYNGDVASGTNIAWETGGARVWAEDGNVVHTTGDETIQGLKTFSNTTAGNDLDINLQSVTNNGTYKMGVEIAASGRRGLWDYSGTGISGEGKWIIFKDTDNVVHVGDDTAQRSKVKIGGITLDFSGTIGSASNTLYIG